MSESDKKCQSEVIKTPSSPPPLKMTANQIAIAALLQQGLNKQQTAKELGITPSYVTMVSQRLNKRYDLTNTSTVKGAYKTIRALSRGEPVGTIREVKDSTALRASELIYDRFQPAVQRIESSSQSIAISIDMSRYSNFGDIENDMKKVSSD